MEPTRLRGTLIVVRNPIHMALGSTETSDSPETGCQDDNNSSVSCLITATKKIIIIKMHAQLRRRSLDWMEPTFNSSPTTRGCAKPTCDDL